MQGILNIQLSMNEYRLMLHFSHLLTIDQNLILGFHICNQDSAYLCLLQPLRLISLFLGWFCLLLGLPRCLRW